MNYDTLLRQRYGRQVKYRLGRAAAEDARD
jgi:hypothetical protein